MANETELVLTGMGVTPYSARGLTQTLAHIGSSALQRRTVNGTLVDISTTIFQKYESTITGDDQDSPAINGIWPGQQLTVDCIVELAYPTSGGSADRPVVSGSSRVSGDYTFYRPQLTMLVTQYSVEIDEWGAAVGWSMGLEEV